MVVHPVRWDKVKHLHFLSYLSTHASSLVFEKAQVRGQENTGCLFIPLSWGDDLLLLSVFPCTLTNLRTPVFTVPVYSLNCSKEIPVLSKRITATNCNAARKELKHFLACAMVMLGVSAQKNREA